MSETPGRVALVGWHEGLAGLVHAWLDQPVSHFVHPSDEAPAVDPVAARAGRAASRFEIPQAGRFKGLPLVSSANWPAILRTEGICRALVLLADGQDRLDQIALARAAGIELIGARHASATILPDAIIGDNVVLHARSLIGYRAEIRAGVIINSGAQIDHHSVIEEGVTIDPGAILAGNVHVGRCARIHTGAIIINRLSIGEGAVIGAGAVVIRDVPPGTTVAGNPARPIMRNPNTRC